MVQPNIKVFPLPYITVSKYTELEPKLKELGKKTKTEISYNFGDQYFEIIGRSQQACDDTSKIIERDLIPHLTSIIVDEYKFHGTFEDFENMLSSNSPPPSASITSTSTPELTRIKGRPLDLGEIEEGPSDVVAVEGGETSYSNLYYETESDVPDSDSDDEFVETFTFAKNIKEPREVLTGPAVNNSKPADYLRIVGNDTGTECSLIDRRIKIVGTRKEAVEEALERFKNLQSIFKRRKKDTQYVACVHYPTEAPEFGLYFCDLERYAQQSYVDLLERPSGPLHVILPVFKDRTGVYAKPAELLDVSQPSPTQQWVQRQHQQRQMQQESAMSLDERMRMASLEHKKQGFGNLNAGMAPDLQPLWGENKTFVVRSSAQSPSPAPKKGTPQPPPYPMKKEPVDDFPSLPSAAPRVAPKKTATRRVMRLTNQKASPGVASHNGRIPSNMENLKIYNFHNIKKALEEGLNGVRGFKGDVKLSARFGKVLWRQITPTIQKKIWSYTDLNDRLMANEGISPIFNNVITMSDETITRMSEVLPHPHSRRVSFEIYANARNQPSVPYQPVIMYMKNQGVVELTKVITASKKVTEIEWVSLDRKFDFQFLLQTEEKTRMDVKPFNTFISKVAVNPETRHITFNNVPDFLEVNYILSKQTTIYRIVFPIVAEITRVERLPLVQQIDSYGYEKILGDTGKGQVWYEFEVFYSTYDSIFKENQSLQTGKLASWTSESIIEGTEKINSLIEYIRCLLTIVEKFEAALR